MLLPRGSSHLSRDRLIGSRWIFGFKDSNVITNNFHFGSDGTIRNYEGSYERSWTLDDGLLRIFAANGQPTLLFHVGILLGNQLLLVASHFADKTGHLHVYLRENGPSRLPRDGDARPANPYAGAFAGGGAFARRF